MRQQQKKLLERYGVEFQHIPYHPFRNMMYVLPIILDAKVVVETGLARGHSTEIFLRALKHTDGHLWTYDIKEYPDTVRKLEGKKLTGRWTFMHTDSVEGGKTWNGKKISLLYLDSHHGANHVYNEFEVWSPYVTNCILVHDTRHHNLDAPTRSLEGIGKIVRKYKSWNFTNLNDPLGMGVLWRK